MRALRDGDSGTHVRSELRDYSERAAEDLRRETWVCGPWEVVSFYQCGLLTELGRWGVFTFLAHV